MDSRTLRLYKRKLQLLIGEELYRDAEEFYERITASEEITEEDITELEDAYQEMT